jgi:nucleoside transporter
MGWKIYSRLALMMFFEYFIWGAWYVTLGTFLALGLHFNANQIAWAAGTTAIGAIFAPPFVGLIADRFLAAQKALGALHFCGAVLLWIAARQQSFAPLYGALIAYSLVYMPTLALTTSLTLRHVSDARQQFGSIRLFGTVGWMVAGLLVGRLGIEATAQPLKIACGCSLFLGLYCFTLPETPPLARGTAAGRKRIILERAAQLLRARSPAVFAGASLLICIPLQFYYAFANLYLNEIGVDNAAGKMTGGQASEAICMMLIPLFFARLGVKYMLAIGMLAWTARYAFFAWGNDANLMWMLWAGIVLHGLCYDLFFVVGQIYIDQKAPPELRAATQGLIAFLTYGVGMFLGAWLSGRVVAAYTSHVAGAPAVHNWHGIWIFASACSLVVLVLFWLFFTDDERSPSPSGRLAGASGRNP